MKKRIILLSLIVAQLLVGCSSFGGLESSPISVYFSEPNRIQFQGKGAGAGFALMSTMGPVGIALGVAIDVGIAKDIQEPARVSGFDMNSYISQGIETQSQAAWKAVFWDEENRDLTAEFPNVEIKRYGFKTTGGADDATSAELIVLVKVSQQEQFEYHYPNDFTDANEDTQTTTIPSYPLADLKRDGALSVLLMKQAVDSVMAKVVEKHLHHLAH